MLLKNILSEDWSQIDERKTQAERGTITCEDLDELEYLISIINKHLPAHSEKDVIYAIAACWHRSAESVPREQFIQQVVFKLCEEF